MLVLQSNTRRSKPGLDLLLETARQKTASMILLSEPNIEKARRYNLIMNQEGNTAIKVLNKDIKVLDTWSRGSCFVRITTQDAAFYSIYLSPSYRIDEFKQKLHEIQLDIERLNHTQVVLGGDFNAKSFAWGSHIEDGRGKITGEWLSFLDLVIMNRGNIPTYIMNSTQSIIDITVCSQSLAGKVREWAVQLEENLSDHNTISFKLVNTLKQNPKPHTNSKPTWRYDPEKEEELQAEIQNEIENFGDNPPIGMEFLQGICDKIFTKRRQGANRKPAYWWNPGIADLRKTCLKQKRRLVRENGRRNRNEANAVRFRNEYYLKKKELKHAILEAQTNAWKKLCNDLNDNIWGNGYKIVCKKFKLSSNTELTTEEKVSIAKKLFPVEKIVHFPRDEVREEEIPPFTLDELLQVYSEIRNKKAPGPDGIVPEITKVLIKTAPDYCLNIFNLCAKRGCFPEEWKVAKLVLLEKEKKPTDTEKSYRPICLLDGIGKIYEKLIQIRLSSEIERNGGLSPQQYGFRSGKSTLDAMLEVRRIGTDAKRRNKLCVMTMADVRNAFGSVPWDGIIMELKRKRVENYIINIIKDYFKNRTVMIDHETLPLTCGVPQGSVLGAILWNIYYDPILSINLPKNTQAIAYADDLALLTTGESKHLIELEISLAMARVNNWMKSRKLQLAPQKTEIIILASNRSTQQVTVKIGGIRVTSKESAKYLGIWFDRDLRMTDHIRKTSARAEEVASNIARLMPNINGPQNAKRKILASVVYSKLFYGVPVWVGTAQIKKYRLRLEKTQRKVMLRQCRAYRTSPTVALQVISSTLPIELMAQERDRIYKSRRNGDNIEQAKEEIRSDLMNIWQNKWDQERTKGQWTKELIPEVKPWAERQFGEVSYELAQFLTGHGNFGTYLKRFKILDDDKCIYCQQVDTVKHTFFECARWQQLRTGCWESLGVEVSETTIINEMLKDKKKWDCISGLITEIVAKKKVDTQRIEDEVARSQSVERPPRTRLMLTARRRLLGQRVQSQ